MDEYKVKVCSTVKVYANSKDDAGACVLRVLREVQNGSVEQEELLQNISVVDAEKTGLTR